jgi:hypothetical protein
MSNEKFDYDDKIKIVEKTRDDTIRFVSNCDSKASIILAIIGILLTVICTEMPTYIISARSDKDFNNNAVMGVYIVCVVASVICFITSVILLICVLRGRVKSDKYSIIYFGDISTYNLESYKIKLRELNKEDFKNYLIDDLYINSKICSRKYKLFNIALVFLICGIAFFTLAILIEVFGLKIPSVSG